MKLTQDDVFMGSRSLGILSEFINDSDKSYRNKRTSFEGVLTLVDMDYDPVYLRENYRGTFQSMIGFDPSTGKHYASPLVEVDDDE